MNLQFEPVTGIVESEEETHTGFRCRFLPSAPSVWLTLFTDLMKRMGDGSSAGLYSLDSEGTSVICTPENLEEKEAAVLSAIQHANEACQRMRGGSAA